MGKSSVVEMLSKYIKEQQLEKNKYLVCKIDCSVFHKKEKLWINILNKLLDVLSEKKVKKVFKFRFSFLSFKKTFFSYNFLLWIKKRGMLTVLFVLSFILYLLYCWYNKSFPKIPIPTDYKETAALITILTLVYTLFKTRSLIFKQNVFLQDHRNEESNFIRSVNEYQQLITLMDKVTKKDKGLKVLLVLDEMDRMHKELLPDIIELIQLFKGIGLKEEDEKILNNISFIFSFNHDILFPIIGKSVSLDDKQLFINSYQNYEGYIEGNGKDAHLNYYKLGKEFMDKYLDLSIYLEEEIDYTKLMAELFTEVDEFRENKVENPTSDIGKQENSGILDPIQNKKAEQNPQNSSLSSNELNSSSFTSLERTIIKETIERYASKVEPRKVIRLKNALIMLKKLNKGMDSIADNEYEKELRDFIFRFLEIKPHEEQGIINSADKEIAATTQNFLKDKSGELEDKTIRHLKFTEYFIHDKPKVREYDLKDIFEE
ncbi:hypothetical protein COJ07_29140 [Bacillus cereus]|nr:hypothetical protein COJ07_29140 [Bacillus cereus]